MNSRRLESHSYRSRSLDGWEGLRFNTFSLPEDRCVRLLLKNHGKQIPESVILGGGTPKHLCTGSHATPIRPPLTRLSRRQSSQSPPHCICGARVRGLHSSNPHRTLRSAGDGGVIDGTTGPIAIQRLTAFQLYAAQLCTCTACGALTSLVNVRLPGDNVSASAVGATTRRNTGAVFHRNRRGRRLQNSA
jgi:hypothetical protein